MKTTSTDRPGPEMRLWLRRPPALRAAYETTKIGEKEGKEGRGKGVARKKEREARIFVAIARIHFSNQPGSFFAP